MSTDLVCLQDIENYAHKVLPRNALDYYRSGAGSEHSLYNNRNAFTKLRIKPRCMQDVSKRNMSTTILGSSILMPIGISPTAMQKMADPEGECATAKAAQSEGTIMILSTIATSSIEEVAEAAPLAIKWFQLYIYKDRELTKTLIQRAEKAGFKALVLTVDAPVFGIRRADIRNKFTLAKHLKLANFVDHKSTDITTARDGSGVNEYVNLLFDSSLQWKDIEWLQSITNLPIILKGILTAEDAITAAELGVAGILVSNHGGRQVDDVPAPIEALPEIVKAVGDKVEVYVDGGFREGTDVFKALALGAKMIFVGRPAIWGLAYAGEQGVKKSLQILRTELDNIMCLTGCSSLMDISRSMIVHENYYSRL